MEMAECRITNKARTQNKACTTHVTSRVCFAVVTLEKEFRAAVVRRKKKIFGPENTGTESFRGFDWVKWENKIFWDNCH